MPALISITINDRPVSVRATATVLQACDSAGVDVPRFCYHERLSVAGNCRRCLVEVQKSPKPVVACARPVTPNRVIYTNTPLVRKAREAVLEFLLLNHPLDCPICDQGGECDLQEEAISFGSDRGRSFERKRSVEDKECGPIVKTIRTRCIHCTRCIRFATEVAGIEALGAFGRGEEREVGSYLPTLLRSELSGNLVDLCPVGALTSKPYAYTARRWELTSVDTLDAFDAFAIDVTVQSRGSANPTNKAVDTTSPERLLRVLPRTTAAYPEVWLSDRSRYSVEGLYNGRVLRPLLAGNSESSVTSSLTPSRWAEALANLAPRLLSSVPAQIIFGSHLNREEVYTTANFAAIRGWASPINTAAFAPFGSALTTDNPWAWNLNQTVSGPSPVSSLSAILIIGTSLRFEGSFLATAIRREQTRRGRRIGSVRSFSSQRLRQSHLGSSLRTLIALVENRLPFVSDAQTDRPSIFLGVESLRFQNGSAIEKFAHVLARRFFSATPKEIRYGVVHSSVGSLASAALSLNSRPVSSALAFTGKILVTLHHGGFGQRRTALRSPQTTFVHAGTHAPEPIAPHGATDITRLPLTSLYERQGHLVTLDGPIGHLRTHRNGVSSSGDRRTIDTLWTSLSRIQGSNAWRRWTEVLSNFEVEVPRRALLNRNLVPFTFNPFLAIETTAPIFTAAALLSPTVVDFALADPISRHSPTIGECSLFLGEDSSFSREILPILTLFYTGIV